MLSRISAINSSNYVEDFAWHSNLAPTEATFCRAALMTLLVLIAWRAPRTKPPVFVGPIPTPSRLSRCQRKGLGKSTREKTGERYRNQMKEKGSEF